MNDFARELLGICSIRTDNMLLGQTVEYPVLGQTSVTRSKTV